MQKSKSKLVLDLQDVSLSPKFKDVIIQLLQDPNKFISYSPASLWGGNSKESLVGAWVLKKSHFGIDQFEKIHGRTITQLLNVKIIEIDTTVPPVKHVQFYKLATEAVDNIREVRRAVMFDAKGVQKKKLSVLAEMYNLKVKFCVSRGYFELTRIDDIPLKHKYLISRNSKDEPVHRYSDFTWTEWDDLLFKASNNIYS